jgi:ferredoxin
MLHLSWIERGLLLLLLAASAALFWWRFRKVVEIIRKSRKTPDFDLHPIGPRLRQFLGEVALQIKVIEQRPVAGVAHAFVFWGFCAFALITLNHLANGFGLPFLSEGSWFGTFYFGLAAMFALAVAISISVLFVRRFIVRPVWLGTKVSVESGFIAFLIFALMITFLVGMYIGEASIAGRVNWWLHTLALFTFLPLIPHTKHLHLVLSPVTVFLKRAGFSRIPPLEGDEDFGLDTGKDVTQIDALQAFSCVECGRCTEHCPAYNTEKVLNPKEIILGLRGYLNQNGAGAEAALLGPHNARSGFSTCRSLSGCVAAR